MPTVERQGKPGKHGNAHKDTPKLGSSEGKFIRVMWRVPPGVRREVKVLAAMRGVSESTLVTDTLSAALEEASVVLSGEVI